MGSDLAGLVCWNLPKPIQIPVAKDKRGEAPFSVDANLLAHLFRGQGSGRSLLYAAPDYVYQRTVHPEDAPDQPEFIEITALKRATRSAINGEAMSPGDHPDQAQRVWRQTRLSAVLIWLKAALSA